MDTIHTALGYFILSKSRSFNFLVEGNADDEYSELTGIEEAPHVHTTLANRPSQTGFKEGIPGLR